MARESEVLVPLPLVLAFRSLAFRRLQSVVAVAGVALGVLALNLIVGIQNGFRQAFVEQILESAGHVTLSAPGSRIGHWEGRIETLRRELPEVIGAAPAILGQAILEVDTAFAGVNFKAIEPDREPEVTRLLERVVAGEATFRGVNEVLVGSKLASELRITVDSPVKLVLPGASSTTSGSAASSSPGWGTWTPR
jgi:lipoprotein-releasing system permease protein